MEYGISMIKLYGYSSLTDEDYYRSVRDCSKYVSRSDSDIFFKIMSNRTILCFDNKYGVMDYDPYDLLSRFINDLNAIDIVSLKDRIDCVHLHKAEIPMFNSISSINPLLRNMMDGSTLTYLSAGDILCSPYHNNAAKTKAGELHLKLLSMLGLGELMLVTPRKSNITLLGIHYLSLNSQDRMILLQKMILKIPIMSLLLQEASTGPVSISEIIKKGQITGTTTDRRASSVKALINYLECGSNIELHNLCSNIYM